MFPSAFWCLSQSIIFQCSQYYQYKIGLYSPIKHDKKVLEMIGRKLKKNNVALDIVDFGEEGDGKAEKLEAFLAAVNSNDTSHIVHVPPGPSALSDVLIK
jgi:26S proteasome regulatory subunit N10